jgi:hypothetical protein
MANVCFRKVYLARNIQRSIKNNILNVIKMPFSVKGIAATLKESNI